MKLHLGCGKRYIPGYTHIDVAAFDHIDYKCDISDMKNIMQDNTADEIYACHVLEHFLRHDILKVLLEWNRVLKPGGVVRIAVPDLEACIKLYLNSTDNQFGAEHIQGLLFGGQRDQYDYHHIGFDFKLLSAFLRQAGFGNIKRYEAKEFLPQQFDDYSLAYLPHRDENHGNLMSLNVIAQKIKHQEHVNDNSGDSGDGCGSGGSNNSDSDYQIIMKASGVKQTSHHTDKS